MEALEIQGITWDEWLELWIANTQIEYLANECSKDGVIQIPEQLKGELTEVLRYATSILSLYRITSSVAYKNWLLILLDVVYSEVFHVRCSKAGQQNCRLRQLLLQLDFLFQRVDTRPFLDIGSFC
ncbi:hypothetical protein [Borrelia sp. P9F1]|uniref:hypothetical protein n=1 Tax=Borrelia sp. P9F1 TaxID=3058374 RepID=UPI002648781D|nr:hypothetical protein [Borrelia sp. P9F1]WKC58529.1 hypothetical protein QYZ68_04755 [Borrelia sp. P9F1]